MMTAHDDEHADEQDMKDAWDPQVGDGTPADAPAITPPVSLLDAQPVRLLGVVQAIAGAVAMIVALGAPVWAALVVAVGLYVFEELKVQRVTPVADPKLSGDMRLTPEA